LSVVQIDQRGIEGKRKNLHGVELFLHGVV